MHRPSLVWVCLVSSLMLGQENHSGRELQKAASVGKTDAGKEPPAETVPSSSPSPSSSSLSSSILLSVFVLNTRSNTMICLSIVIHYIEGSQRIFENHYGKKHLFSYYIGYGFLTGPIDRPNVRTMTDTIHKLLSFQSGGFALFTNCENALSPGIVR